MQPGVYRTICGICHGGCGMFVRVSASGIESITGDPDHPASRGYLCPKAFAARELATSPDRLTRPLRRTPAGLKPVSWDEALDFAAERLTAIRSQHGPAAIMRASGAPVNYDARDGFLHFMQALGSPNLTGAGNTCHVPRLMGWLAVAGAKPEPDFDRARLIVFWGNNPAATERYGSYCAYEGFDKIIARAKVRGVRVIVIDPVCSETAAQASEWIEIKPGTDVAFGLALINVVINEKLYNEPFVAAYTSGFEELKQHVQTFTPVWAEAITGVPQDKIVAFAREFAGTRPAAVCDGNGLDMYCNVVDAARTIAILLGLTANLDVPGGSALLPFAKQLMLHTVPPQQRLWYDRYPLFKEVPFPVVKESLLRNDPARPRALIVHHHNPVLIQANQERTLRALAKLEFLMVDDIFLSSTAEVADLVLPSTSPFERYGYRAHASFDRGFVAFSRPVADPPGEARDVAWMECELARRMGLGDSYPFRDSRTWVEHMLKPCGVTLEQLERESIVFCTPQPEFEKYKKTGFQTPSGKLEFVSQMFAKANQPPLPLFTEGAGVNLETARAVTAYPLLCTNRRTASYVHTKFRNLKAQAKAYPEPLLWLSPVDADARQIAEGDRVELSSPQGHVEIKVRLKSDLRPGLAMMDFGWGNPTDGLASSNRLTNDSYWNPISGSHPQRLFACEVVKLG